VRRRDWTVRHLGAATLRAPLRKSIKPAVWNRFRGRIAVHQSVQRKTAPQGMPSGVPVRSAATPTTDRRHQPMLHLQRPLASPAAQRMSQTDAQQSDAGLSGSAPSHFGHNFSRIEVNEPGDPYEREADRVADQVMATRAHPAVESTPPRLQRTARQPAGRSEVAASSVAEALASPGQPLDAATRAFIEPRFGHDFGRVRVHTDARAAESASAVQALAYTVGHNVVFGAGKYAPGTSEGRRLLAHELAHVVQQAGSPTAARRGIAGEGLVSLGGRASGLQRQEDTSRATPSSDGSQRGLQADGTGPAPQADACAGWESDPQSFSKKVADHFLRTKLNLPVSPMANSVKCFDPTPSFNRCQVIYSENLKIEVRWNTTVKHVAADHVGGTKVCLYEYSCDATGDLILKELRCIDRGTP
jgi:uncharacterized protein DUF4157